MTAGRIVARARACVGVRFRPQGRDPAFGLDCVGLVGVALGRELAGDHPMRCGEAARVARAAATLGMVAVDAAMPGDVLLFETGPGQLHLAIRSEGGIIHADAGARRVVERPGPAPWRQIGAWREA